MFIRPTAPRATASHVVTVLVAVMAATVSLAGCQAGQQAQTSQPYQATSGQNVNVPDHPSYYGPYLAIRGLAIVVDGTGKAVLVGKIVNKTPDADTLVSVTNGTSAATLPSGGVTMRPEEAVSFGTPSGPTATWASIDTPVGRWTEVAMTFATAGDVRVRVLVEAHRYDYADTYFPSGA